MNILLKRPPTGPLAAHVEALWALSEPSAGDSVIRMPTPRSHLVWALPNGCCRVHTAGAPGPGQDIDTPMLCIADTRVFSASFIGALPRLVIGAEFGPGGLQHFLPAPLSEPSRSQRPLGQAWGELSVREGTERLVVAMQHSVAATLDAFEDILQAQWRATADPAFPAQEALATLLLNEDSGHVADAAKRFGLNERQFREKVRHATGLTPKRYARLQRFTRALKVVHRGSDDTDAALAASCGYFDQAHFIHEFKAMAGMTPSEYRRRHGDSAHSACLFTTLRKWLAVMAWPDVDDERADAATVSSTPA